MNINKNKLTLKPCIPDEWEEYFIRYQYHSSIYNIKVKNRYQSNEVKEIKINGIQQEEKTIQLIDNHKIYDVEIVI